MVFYFDNGNENYGVQSTAHELVHSFSLPHGFEFKDYTNHSFYKGCTDNIMNYSFIDIGPVLQAPPSNDESTNAVPILVLLSKNVTLKTISHK